MTGTLEAPSRRSWFRCGVSFATQRCGTGVNEAVNRGYATKSPLPSAVPKSCDQFVPYIYTRDEVRQLLEATSSYRKTTRCLEPHTFRTVLLLLYGAGLRVGEALSLTVADVDLQAAALATCSRVLASPVPTSEITIDFA